MRTEKYAYISLTLKRAKNRVQIPEPSKDMEKPKANIFSNQKFCFNGS